MPMMCIRELVEAVDKAKNPPTTDEELEKWVEKWRKKEAAYYGDKELGIANAEKEITAKEIRCIVELSPVRKENLSKGGIEKKTTYSGNRYPLGKCSLSKNRQGLSIGTMTVTKYGLNGCKSCDVEVSDKQLVIDFRNDDGGEFVVSIFTRPPFFAKIMPAIDKAGMGDYRFFTLSPFKDGRYLLTPREK